MLQVASHGHPGDSHFECFGRYVAMALSGSDWLKPPSLSLGPVQVSGGWPFDIKGPQTPYMLPRCQGAGLRGHRKPFQHLPTHSMHTLSGHAALPAPPWGPQPRGPLNRTWFRWMFHLTQARRIKSPATGDQTQSWSLPLSAVQGVGMKVPTL